MSASIFRYEVPVDDQPHGFNIHGDPLAVGCRDPRKVEFWALDDPDQASAGRYFQVVGTGHDLPDTYVQHWGTAMAAEGRLVWHLVEVARRTGACGREHPGVDRVCALHHGHPGAHSTVAPLVWGATAEESA